MKRIALGVALAIPLLPLAFAQDDPDPFLLERLLPDNTLLYVNIPNSDAVSADYKNSNLYKLIHNEEVHYFLQPLRDYFEKHKKEAGNEKSWNDMAKEETGLTIDEMIDLAQGPIGFGLIDLPLNEEHKLDLVFSLGNPDAKKLKEAADKVRAKVKESSTAPIESESTFKGVTVHAFGTREQTFFTALLGRTLILATTEARMQSVITAYVDKNLPTLEKSEGYKKAKARVSKDNRHFFQLYAHVPSILKTFRKEIGDDTNKVLEKLGVTDLTGVAATLSYDGPSIRERYFVGMSATNRGIPKLLAGKASPDAAAKYVPAGAIGYSHMSFDLADIYDTILAMLEADPPTADDARKWIEEQEKKLGLSFRNDLLAAIGDQWTAYSAFPEAGGAWPDTVYIVSLRDAAKFEASVGKILAEFKQKLESMTFRGQEIKFLSVPLFEGSREFDDFAPSFGYCYFIRDGRLFLSQNPLSLKRLIARTGDDISKDPKFGWFASKFGGTPDAFTYFDIGRLFTLIYNTAEPFLHLAREFCRDRSGEMFLDLARLPLGETIGGLIGSSYTGKRTEADGVVLESYSTLGLSTTSVAAFTAGVAGLAVPLFLARGGPMGGVAENERIAQLTLQFIAQAQETLKNSDSDGNGVGDYWTRDVAGLYALKSTSGQIIFLLDPQTACADPDGAANYDATKGKSQDSKGYYYKVLITDQEGDKYQLDADKDGNAWTNKTRFGVVAYPANYGVSGRMTFLINEEGKVFKKDTAGAPVDTWPGRDPSKQGWAAAE